MFRERYKKTGVKPAPLLARPRLKPQDAWYLEAFQSLSASRPSGFGGPEPIPLSEIKAYLDLNEVHDVREKKRLLNIVQLMDMTWLKYQHEQAEMRRKNAAAQPRR